MGNTSDAELVTRWSEGDATAGQLLVHRHYPAVFRFFRGRVDPAAGADLAQQTFETVCEQRDRFRDLTSVRAYILAIARRHLLAHLRRQRRNRARITPMTHSYGDRPNVRSMTSVFSAHERSSRVATAMRRLPLDDQLILELSANQDLNAREIADVLECSHSTLRGRLMRARRRLRERLQVVDAGA